MSLNQSIGTDKKADNDSPEPLQNDFFNEFTDLSDEREGEFVIPKTAQNERKLETFFYRLRTGILIFDSFLLLIAMGPFYCSLMTAFAQVGIFYDLIGLKRYPCKDKSIGFTIKLLWVLFLGTWFFSTVDNLSGMLTRQANGFALVLLTHRSILFFAFYVSCFMGFVLSLKMGFLRYQVRLFAITHLALLPSALALGFSHLVIYEGMVWYLAAGFIMTSNDNFAYIFGVLFGRTKLIAISPKKTVEGFFGGIIGAFGTDHLDGHLAAHAGLRGAEHRCE